VSPATRAGPGQAYLHRQIRIVGARAAGEASRLPVPRRSVTEVIVAAVGAVVSSVTVKVLSRPHSGLPAASVTPAAGEAVVVPLVSVTGLDVGKGVADVGAGQGV